MEYSCSLYLYQHDSMIKRDLNNTGIIYQVMNNLTDESMKTIQVYIPNLPERKERRDHIISQYADKSEFNLHILTPAQAEHPVKSLWLTFIQSVEEACRKNYDFFVFGEDDHVFTDAYNYPSLVDAINHAQQMDADLLSGGVSWIDLPVQSVYQDLFQFSRFTGMQFTVIFKRAYDTIIKSKDTMDDATDKYLSKILGKKLVVYPFISIQKEFGYSDVTVQNNIKHRVEKLFQKAESTLHVLNRIKAHYLCVSDKEELVIDDNMLSDFQISTHIIHLPERAERQTLYESQFADKKEYDIVSIAAHKHRIGAIGLWNSICNAVSKAKVAKEDAILICEDDHIFTKNYCKEDFIKKVYEAGLKGADLLSGGIGGFGNAVPISKGLFWVDWLWCTQFIVIYSKAYDTILEAEFGEKDVADEFLSKILLNKMVIYPFISKQMDFGYSDVTDSNNKKGKISDFFKTASIRMKEFIDMMPQKHSSYSRLTTNNRMQETVIYDKLNIGCGENIKKGWLNVDLLPVSGAYYLNASYPFPYKDDSFQFIFSEHMFEHLTYHGGKKMLQEVFRTLRPGGIFRIALPSLSLVRLLLQEQTSPKVEEYISWSQKYFSQEILHDFKDVPINQKVSFVINNFMRLWGHKMIYDACTIQNMLQQTGFIMIKQVSIGKSETSELNNLEEHDTVIPEWANQMETMVFEATKPSL